MVIPKILSSIRNAGLAKKIFAVVPASKASISILDALYNEGLINGYSIQKDGYSIRVYLSYFGSDIPLVSSLKGISRPGLRKFISYKNLVKYYSGRFVLLSTSHGIIDGTRAISLRIGGELLASRYYFLFGFIKFLALFSG